MMLKALSQRIVFPDPDTGRLDWVDTAKAMLITMVVIGHFDTLELGVKRFLYAFHVPAFLVVTGFLLPKSLPAMSTSAFLRKYIFPYARLTIFFIAASIALWWVVKGRGAGGGEIWDVVVNGFYGTQSQAQRFMHGNGPLWYLPFLVSSFLGLLIAIRLPRLAGFAFVLAYAIFSLTHQGTRWPWSLDSAGVGLLFIMCGYLAKMGLQRALPSSGLQPFTPSVRLLAFGLCAALAVLTLGIAYVNGATNINVLLFGNNPLLLVIGALAGTAMVTCLSLVLPGTALARHLSRHTLVIFCTHIFLVREASRHIHVDNIVLRLLAVVATGVAITLFCSLISWVMMPLIDRFVLWRTPAPQPAKVKPTGSVVGQE
jgi:fucose 4-O-acetylase-like acetyltransferase